MNLADSIYVAGHRGMLGSALVRLFKKSGFSNIIERTHDQLDLMDPLAVDDFLKTQKPAVVVLAAARVGGIWANNSYPANFLHDNLAIAHNVIHSAWRHGVKRLLFLGSSCIYPKLASQPIVEEALLTAPLEHTNEAYALAKIVGL
ncbi:MAG: GDP-fucose synthetase, partial [Verrucomicrobia bacterium 21-51-4]